VFFAPKLDLADHIARLRAADLFLDTWPCNAHTTASEALWAGVPVLTVPGPTFASRVAASLVTACGLADLACADDDALRDARDRARQRARDLQGMKTAPRRRTAARCRCSTPSAWRATWTRCCCACTSAISPASRRRPGRDDRRAAR
jgi:predicted O-linked N-acetylglucosamine transferase (SPINDLY family)